MVGANLVFACPGNAKMRITAGAKIKLKYFSYDIIIE